MRTTKLLQKIACCGVLFGIAGIASTAAAQADAIVEKPAQSAESSERPETPVVAQLPDSPGAMVSKRPATMSQLGGSGRTSGHARFHATAGAAGAIGSVATGCANFGPDDTGAAPARSKTSGNGRGGSDSCRGNRCVATSRCGNSPRKAAPGADDRVASGGDRGRGRSCGFGSCFDSSYVQ